MNWEVTESRFERESGTVFLEIRERPAFWESTRCPKDGGLVSCYDHTEALNWRHLNVFQHHCEITCRLSRGKCRQCGHVFRVRPPWEGLSIHFTKEFEAFALLLIREMPMAKVAEVTGASDMRLWRMLFKHVDGAYAQADFCNVCCVGVDEMSVRKGQEYISVFADLAAKKVIFATEGHDASTWETFVQALEGHHGHRHAITQVSMDMSAAYQKGVKENCRNAQVVFDKFHVLADANKRVDQVRQAEARVGGAEVRNSLGKSQWLWRKNPENLNEKEQARLAKIQEKNLCTGKAYQMRLVLQVIYRSPNAGVAQKRFKVWCRWGALGGSVLQVLRFQSDGQDGADAGGQLGRHLGPLEMGADQRVYGGPQQRIQRSQEKGSRLSFTRLSHHDALSCGRQTPPTPRLIPLKTWRNHSMCQKRQVRVRA